MPAACVNGWKPVAPSRHRRWPCNTRPTGRTRGGWRPNDRHILKRAGLLAKQTTRWIARASPVFARKPAPTTACAQSPMCVHPR
ncbi:hypothetical protein F7661_22205 [Pseudomonas sp. CFA]|nr:hypothetical protein F7661_22205 [Pseudomonas sp. CFA]